MHHVIILYSDGEEDSTTYDGCTLAEATKDALHDAEVATKDEPTIGYYVIYAGEFKS